MAEPPNYGQKHDGAIQLAFAEKNFWNFYDYIKNSVFAEREKAQKLFFDDAYNIRKYADIILLNKKIRIADFVDISTYRTILGQLIVTWSNQGLFDPYNNFFKWLFGFQTNIHITVPSPAVLDIKISNYNVAGFVRKLEAMESLRKIQDEVNYRAATQIILEVTTNELLGFLNTLLPTCYVCKFQFIDG
jgi:hypothetical protein